MDKAEYHIKLEELNRLVDAEDFEGALAVAESIDWRKVKSVRTLCMVADIYEMNGELEDSMQMLEYARKRSSVGKMILYRQVELAIKMKQISQAEDYYDQYLQVSQNDSSKYVLQYKIAKAKERPLDEQIAILEEYKEREYTERWVYELARLYKKAGKQNKCVETCDDLILWFGEGKYVAKAMEMKMTYQPLTPDQKAKYDAWQKKKESSSAAAASAAAVAAAIASAGDKDTEKNEEADSSEKAGENAEEAARTASDGNAEGEDGSDVDEIPLLEPEEELVHVDTEQLQERLSQSFQEILSGFNRTRITNAFEALGRATGSEMPPEPEEDNMEDYHVTELEPENFDHSKISASRGDAIARKTISEPREIPEEEKPEKPEDKEIVSVQEVDLNALFAETSGVFAAEAGGAADAAVEEPTIDLAAAIAQETEAAEKTDIDNTETDAATAGTAEAASAADVSADTIMETAAEAAADVADGTSSEDDEEQSIIEALAASVEAALAEEAAQEQEEQAKAEAEKAETEKAEAENAETAVEAEETPAAEEPAEITEAAVADELTKAVTEMLAEENADASAEVPVEETAETAAEVPVEEIAETAAEMPVQEAEAAAATEPGDVLPDLDLDLVRELQEEQTDLPITDEEEEASKAAAAVQIQEVKAEPEAAAAVQIQKVKAEPEAEATQALPDIEEETPEERRMRIMNENRPVKLSAEQKQLFSYFAKIPGMDEQILDAINGAYAYADEKTSHRGNIAIMGSHGTGKSRLSKGLVKALCKEFGMDAAKYATLDASDMNAKDPAVIVNKMAGGFLLIERASFMTEDTLNKLSQAMDFRTDSMILIIEDDKANMRKLLADHPEFAAKFETLISIPVFTNDELVTFARTYAKENGYRMDEMGVLALYTKIGNNQREDEPITVGKVKDMVDGAIAKASGPRFGRRLSKRHTDVDGRILLYEKDFD